MTLALDFGPRATTSQQLVLGRDDPNGYPFDLAQNDDVFQYVAAITNIDKPIRLPRADRPR